MRTFGKLPTGGALEEEAVRLGVSLHGTLTSGAQGRTTLNEPELQSRVLAARAERRGAILNMVQSVGIVATLVLTLVIAAWSHRAQQHEKSADLMIKFDELLEAGGSGRVSRELDLRGNLDHTTLSGDELDDALDEFLSNYESIDDAQRYHLIDEDMAYDAFEYDLEKALKDRTILAYIAESRSRAGEGDVWDGVLHLARAWKIPFTLPPAGAQK